MDSTNQSMQPVSQMDQWIAWRFSHQTATISLDWWEIRPKPLETTKRQSHFFGNCSLHLGQSPYYPTQEMQVS